MKKHFFLIGFFVLLSALHAAAQTPCTGCGNFKQVRLVNGDSLMGSTDGTIYYNTVSNKFRFRQNGQWVTFSTGGGNFWPLSGNATLTGSVNMDADGNDFALFAAESVSLASAFGQFYTDASQIYFGVNVGSSSVGIDVINGIAIEAGNGLDARLLSAAGDVNIAADAGILTLGANTAQIVMNSAGTISITGTVGLPSTTSLGNVSATEFTYLDGVTSSIQTQLNNRWATSGTTTVTTPTISGAPTFSGGRVQFTPAAGYGGMNVGSFAGIPTTSVGDIWYNSNDGGLMGRTSSGNLYMTFTGGAMTSTRLAFFSGAYTLNEDADMTFTGATNTLAVPRITLSPTATLSGLNVGSVAGAPSTLSNGDIWLNSSTSKLMARIGGASVALGAAGDFWPTIGSATLTGDVNILGSATNDVSIGNNGSNPVNNFEVYADNSVYFDVTSGADLTFLDFASNGWDMSTNNAAGGGTVGYSTASVASTGVFTGLHMFTPTASVSGLNVGSVAGNPSSLSNADVWYNSSTNLFRGRIGGSSADFLMSTSGLTSTRIPYASAASTLTDEADFTYTAASNLLNVGSATDYVHLDGTDGAPLIHVTADNLNLFGFVTAIGAGGGNSNSSTSLGATGLTSSARGSLNETNPFAFAFNAAGNAANNNGQDVTFTAGTAYPTSGDGNGGDITMTTGQKRAAGSGTDGDFTINANTGNFALTSASATATSTGTFRFTNSGGTGTIVSQSTTGNRVFSVTTTATSDDPVVNYYQNRTTTTNATPATIHTVTTADVTTTYITGTITARRTGGVSGTAEDGAAYEFKAVYKNTTNAVLIGSATITVIGESQAGWDVTLNISGDDVQIQVTGAANNNITWHLSELKIMTVSS